MIEQSSEKFEEVDDVDPGQPSYSTRWMAEYANSEYDKFRFKKMSVFPDVLSVVRDRGTLGQIFCSALHLEILYEVLKAEKEEVLDLTKEDDALLSDDPPSQKTTMFEIKAKEQYHVVAPGICPSDLQVNPLYQMSVTHCTIHFLQKGLSGNEILWQVDYNAGQEVQMGQVGFTNIASNIPHMSCDEVVQGDKHPESGLKQMLGLEQKSIALIKDSVPKFFKPGQLVLDSFCEHAVNCEGFSTGNTTIMVALTFSLL